MIAVAILSSITVIIYGSYQQTFKSQRIVEANLNRYRAARLAMDRILRDVQMSYLSNNVVPGTEQTPRTFFEGVRRSDVDELRFSYFGHQRLYAESKEADTAAVGFFGGRDRENPRQLNLYRKETRRLQADRFENIPGETELLCDDIVRLEFKYYQHERKEWLDHWSTSQADAQTSTTVNTPSAGGAATSVQTGGILPSRVQVRLVVHDELGNEMVFVSEVRLAMFQLVDTSGQS
jgi:general secretion pathway protein J